MKKIEIEIWSDVMCPFCYIGKRRLESALESFGREKVNIVWKSFQLDPGLKTDPQKNTVQHLAESKGWTLPYTQQVTAQVTGMAAKEGLQFNFDKAVVANSFDAHRLSQYAKSQGKGNELEELLFAAYFTEGKNTADHQVLAAIAEKAGLNRQEVENVLASDMFSEQVKNDIRESEQLGVRGVPFFVFDRKFAISGAQEQSVFLSTLKKAAAETVQEDHTGEGASCEPNGECK